MSDDPYRERSRSAGRALKMIVIGGVLLLVSFGTACQDLYRDRAWSETIGVVVDHTQLSSGGRNRSSVTVPIFEFEDQRGQKRRLTARGAGDMPRGAKRRIRYHPRDVYSADLAPGEDRYAGPLAFGVLGMLVLPVGLFLWRRA